MQKIINREWNNQSGLSINSFFILFLVFVLFYSHKATAQEDFSENDKQSQQVLLNNFSIDWNGVIFWQRVNETTLSKTQLIDLIIESGYFQEIDMTDEKLVCRLRPYQINLAYHDFSLFNVTAYLTRSLITGTVVFDFKPQQYRVTVKNIYLINNTEDDLGQVSSLETEVLTKRQDIKMPFFRVESELLDKDFTLKTSFSKSEDNW